MTQSNTIDSTSVSPAKRVKIETDNYVDWLSDVIYVRTTSVEKTPIFEIVNKELEKYDAEPQIVGDPLKWWRSREGSLPNLAQVAS